MADPRALEVTEAVEGDDNRLSAGQHQRGDVCWR
jgi:hypothetical protein